MSSQSGKLYHHGHPSFHQFLLSGFHRFVVAMAEAGISEPQLPSVQTTVLPTQNLSPKLDTETRTSDNELLDCLDKNDQPQATATPPLPEEVGLQEDDDVQFVFSVPRRRRKRRKR